MRRIHAIFTAVLTLALLASLGAAPRRLHARKLCGERRMRHDALCLLWAELPLGEKAHKSGEDSAKPSCPLAVAHKPLALNRSPSPAVAMLTVNELQTSLVAWSATRAVPRCDAPAIPPATLLRLGCALTI